MLHFFKEGKLLKELIVTTITLISKIKYPDNVGDRPISCCNVLHKCIRNVLANNRLREVLPDIINENQGGFVHGRFIIHNIMIIQDIVKHYGMKSTSPGCLMKTNIQKPYDTVDWTF